MARQKEFLKERKQTSFRLEEVTKKMIEMSKLRFKVSQTLAVNDGLRLWAAWKYGDKHLKQQLDAALVFGERKTIEIAKEYEDFTNEKAGTKSSHSGTTG